MPVEFEPLVMALSSQLHVHSTATNLNQQHFNILTSKLLFVYNRIYYTRHLYR